MTSLERLPWCVVPPHDQVFELNCCCCCVRATDGATKWIDQPPSFKLSLAAAAAVAAVAAAVCTCTPSSLYVRLA